MDYLNCWQYQEHWYFILSCKKNLCECKTVASYHILPSLWQPCLPFIIFFPSLSRSPHSEQYYHTKWTTKLSSIPAENAAPPIIFYFFFRWQVRKIWFSRPAKQFSLISDKIQLLAFSMHYSRRYSQELLLCRFIFRKSLYLLTLLLKKFSNSW